MRLMAHGSNLLDDRTGSDAPSYWQARVLYLQSHTPLPITSWSHCAGVSFRSAHRQEGMSRGAWLRGMRHPTDSTGLPVRNSPRSHGYRVSVLLTEQVTFAAAGSLHCRNGPWQPVRLASELHRVQGFSLKIPSFAPNVRARTCGVALWDVGSHTKVLGVFVSSAPCRVRRVIVNLQDGAPPCR
jgi:hypothetical protein